MPEPSGMSGRVCMVTGSNRGIGKATALGLARRGATVVMVCRDQGQGEAAVAELKVESGNPAVDLMLADLSSQASIRQLVADFRGRYQQLHVLVNNAGLTLKHRSVTVDGVETTFAVNHLAPFLLTNLLLDVLRASAPARIVNVSSMVHRWGTIDFDDLQGERAYNMDRAYNQSKLADVLFTYELARRLEGTGVTVNCLQPGMVATDFAREYTGFKRFMVALLRPFMRTPAKGAETSVYLASSPEVEGVTGKYFASKKEAKSSKESHDAFLSKRLWEVSAHLAKTHESDTEREASL